MPGHPELRLGRLLSIANAVWQERTYAGLLDQDFPDIRVSHSPVFRLVDDGGTNTATLAQRAGMTKQSMGYLVGTLEALGYVEQVPDPADRRARLVRLTPRGQAAQAALVEISNGLEADLEAELGETELSALRRGLKRLSE